ncbi:hypothetical protein PPACK8108_LOCUS19276, partial [Phakopsora pachyrhizi]
ESQDRFDVIRLLRLSRQLKESREISSVQLLESYQGLIKLFGYYGLYTQLYAITNELFLNHSELINDQLWSTILESFLNCGRSVNIFLDRMNSESIRIGPKILNLLIRASTVDRNLVQVMHLLKQSVESDSIHQIDKVILSQLVNYLSENGLTKLSIDIFERFLTPIDQNRLGFTVDLLRNLVDRCDVESTLRCFRYLVKNHRDELIDDRIVLEDGLLNLINLQNLRTDLTVEVLKFLVLIKRRRNLESVKLIPIVGSLCKSSKPDVKRVMEILISSKDEMMMMELIEFYLMVGHLGGFENYQKILIISNRSEE